MKRKIFLGILIVIAVMCLFAISISATEINGVHYSLDDNSLTAEVSRDNQTATTAVVTIPSTVEYGGKTYKVNSIKYGAFEGNTSIQELRILSEYITIIPSGMIANTYTNTEFTKIYVDFSRITTINQAGFNPSNQTNGNNPQENPFYFYDAKAFLEDGSDVVVECPDFSNCQSIGQAAFQGAKFKDLVIPEGCELSTGGQQFRQSTIETLKILGSTTREKIGTYSFEGCANLKTIRIESPVTEYASNAFTKSSAIDEIYIDLSQTKTVGNCAFTWSTAYDQGNTTTQWYNLKGEKMVDLSSMENFTGNYGAFSSSNIGSAEKIVWPTAIKQLSNQTFRRCNIAVPMYFNAAEGVTLSIGSYVMDGNTPPIVVLGEGVTTYDGGVKDTILVSLAESITFGTTALDSSGKGNASGSTFYYKATSSDVSNAKFTSVIISDATVQTFKGCGLIATATPVDGEKVTFNYYEHKYNEVPDNTVCPAGSIMIYTCIGCGDSYSVTDEETYISDTHEFSLDNGATIVNIVYENGNYYSNGIITKKCAFCDAETTPDVKVESYSPLFVALGYSMSEDNASVKFISHSVQANTKAIDEYKKITGKNIEYGVLAAIATDDGEPLEIVDGVVKAKANAVMAKMTGTEYSKITIKLNGVPENVAVNCNAYIVVDGTIKYLCNDEILDKAVAKIIVATTEPETTVNDEE
ncbi:MAG: leucine-rich repeat protein [Clostridia bacterium]|nr:leucine-rich repeat protein [Clostridia bacterium]